MTFSVNSGGADYPPKGVRGGLPGAATQTFVERLDGTRHELPIFFDEELVAGERLVCFGSGGGGYGSPSERDPARIRKSLREQLITPEHAANVYSRAGRKASEPLKSHDQEI